MYTHATLHINYTTYDVRRQHDTLNPKTPCRFILLPSDTSNDPDAHPFIYARVLGIYHAYIRYGSRPPKRMDFLWVRWLDYDEEAKGGWDVERLDRLTYGKCRNNSELLDAFGFVDPQHALRATHLIPDFKSGIESSHPSIDPSHLVCDNNEGDWKYHYINRLVVFFLMQATLTDINHWSPRQVCRSRHDDALLRRRHWAFQSIHPRRQ